MESPVENESPVIAKMEAWQDETAAILRKLDRKTAPVPEGKKGALKYRLCCLRGKIQELVQTAQL